MRLGKPCSPEPTLWNIWVYCGGGDPKDRPHESSHDLTETNGEPWITETFCKWFATLPRLHVWKSWDDASDSIEMLTAKQPQLFFKWNVPIARGRLPISHLFSFDRLAIFSHHITAASTYFRLCRDANCIIFKKKRLVGLMELCYSLFHLLSQWLQTQFSTLHTLCFWSLWIKFKLIFF